MNKKKKNSQQFGNKTDWETDPGHGGTGARHPYLVRRITKSPSLLTAAPISPSEPQSSQFPANTARQGANSVKDRTQATITRIVQWTTYSLLKKEPEKKEQASAAPVPSLVVLFSAQRVSARAGSAELLVGANTTSGPLGTKVSPSTRAASTRPDLYLLRLLAR